MSDAPAAKTAYAPPSLSVRVRCAVDEKHSMSGLFVILRMALAGPSHPSIDKVIAVHDGAADPAAPASAPAENPDAVALATRFVCTIVDAHGFLQPVHDDSNPWHEIFAPDPPLAPPRKGVAPKTRDMARIPVDTGGTFVGCLLRHPQPSFARALTRWLNTGDDHAGHGFAAWNKARSPLAGEKPLGGRELLARVLDLSKDTSSGTQLVLSVSEDAADYLPPRHASHEGWLLYHDMPHGACAPVQTQVKALQRRLGLLRFPIGGESNAYAPDKVNDGKFDTRTLSAVLAFQQQAAEGKAVQPLAWPPGHTEQSDGRHDWWFVVAREVPVDKLEGVLPACCDEKTWNAIDAWVAARVRRPGMILVKNPVTYMRWDAALSVLAWKKLAATFGVRYDEPGTSEEETQLASGYSLADLNAGLELGIAHPHKTGHAIDFGVVTDESGPLSDWSRPRSNWPIHYEGQWVLWNTGNIDKTEGPRRKLADAKKARLDRDAAQKKSAVAETAANDAVTAANALDPPNPAKQKSATAARDRASIARAKADTALADATAAVDKAQKDLDAAQKQFEAYRDDPRHLHEWWIHFRLYAHSRLDVFGDPDRGFDALYKAVDGMTVGLVKSLNKDFGDTPAADRDAFLAENLKFLSDWENELKGNLGPPESRSAAGRALVRDTVFRATVRQWVYNPYSRGAGKPGDEIHPGTDTDPLGYLDAEKSAKPGVPPASRSFVNLTYLGWRCGMFRIGGQVGRLRDPHIDGQKAPRQAITAVSTLFGKIVGLIDRMGRDGSDEKGEVILSKQLQRHLPDLDVDFMKRWARALTALRPNPPRGVPIVVTLSKPQVTIELTATDAGLAQLQPVWDKLEESGKDFFVLVAAGPSTLLDPALIATSGKPGLVAADAGKIDTGSAWRAKLENVATLFKEKVATANIAPDAKAAATPEKKPAVRSVKRDPKDWQITLQPVFEKVTPKSLDEVAFQPQHPCELPAPGHGEPLEWWHYQHKDSVKKLYPLMLKDIGYAAELLFRKRQAPEQDEPEAYAGRGIGANPVQEHLPSFFMPAPKAPENGDTESARVW